MTNWDVGDPEISIEYCNPLAVSCSWRGKWTACVSNVFFFFYYLEIDASQLKNQNLAWFQGNFVIFISMWTAGYYLNEEMNPSHIWKLTFVLSVLNCVEEKSTNLGIHVYISCDEYCWYWSTCFKVAVIRIICMDLYPTCGIRIKVFAEH